MVSIDDFCLLFFLLPVYLSRQPPLLLLLLFCSGAIMAWQAE